MTDTAALPDWLRLAGIVVTAVLAAGAVLAPTVRARAWSMLGALVLTPVLLVAEIWHSPQLHAAHDRPAAAALEALAALAVVAGLAWLGTRRPGALAVLALAALPFRVPVQSGGSTANLLLPLYAIIGAGALAWLRPRLSARRARERARAPGALEWALLGFVVLYALQATYSPDPGKALEQIVFFYVPFALLFALLREVAWTPRRLRWAGGVLAGLALAFAGVGFVEFATRRLLLNPKVIASNQIEDYFRVNSLFFDPNIYGRFLALVMIGLAAVMLWARRPRHALPAVAALVVLWSGLLTTLSQSSFAALLVGLAALAWLRWGARAVLPPALAAVAVALLLVLAFPGALHADLKSWRSLDRATSGRADLILGGARLARARPLLGWGSGSFEAEYRRHERASGRAATSASHTIPVTVAAEQGAVGLLAFAALLVLATGRLLRRARRSPVRALLGAAFVALVLHTWLYAAFLEDPVTWTLLALGSALVLPRAAAVERAQSAPPAVREPALARS